MQCFQDCDITSADFAKPCSLGELTWIKEGLYLLDESIPGHLMSSFREGVQKNRFFLGNSPKQRTPPTHPYGLGLT